NGAPQQQQGQAAQVAPNVVEAVGRREPLLVQLKKVQPPDFDGRSNDPIEAQGWFKTIESTLNMMELTDNEKVKCASFCLTMDAKVWWESVERKHNVNEMTWVQFTEEFNEKYFNANITREHWDQLNDIRQGNMTVTE
ncbi:hypothetical protein, partial [Proteus mirabilis]|uniref:hypothetical protein n=1 Tax=Proteus mirabilis TaxID=584 RepID=UPI0015C582A7